MKNMVNANELKQGDKIVVNTWNSLYNRMERKPATVMAVSECSGNYSVMVKAKDYGSDGEPTGEYQFDSKGALRALELIGKHLGMYNDKLQVTNKIDTGQLDSVLAQLRGGGSG